MSLLKPSFRKTNRNGTLTTEVTANYSETGEGYHSPSIKITPNSKQPLFIGYFQALLFKKVIYQACLDFRDLQFQLLSVKVAWVRPIGNPGSNICEIVNNRR